MPRALLPVLLKSRRHGGIPTIGWRQQSSNPLNNSTTPSKDGVNSIVLPVCLGMRPELLSTHRPSREGKRKKPPGERWRHGEREISFSMKRGVMKNRTFIHIDTWLLKGFCLVITSPDYQSEPLSPQEIRHNR